MPVLPVRLGAPETQPTAGPYQAQLDTGADISVMPRDILLSIQAPSLFEAQLRSPWGETHPLVIYMVDLLIEEHLLAGVQVAADELTDELILGRNVLNKLPVFLDGPQRQTHIPVDALVERLRAGRARPALH